MHVASLSGRPISHHAAITALRSVELVPCYACRVPVGTPYRLSYCYHGTAPLWLVPCYACRVPVGTPYSLSYCSHGTAPCGLYRVMHVASLPGRLIVSHAAITALRPVGLVPCYAYRVPVGTPYSLSYCSHGTAPLWGLYRVMHVASLPGRLIVSLAAITALRPVACTVLCISRPCRDAL